MKLQNLVEVEVVFIVNELLNKNNDRCSCDKCKMDIAAIALNNLHPKYVVTKEGKLYSKVSNNMNRQFNTDILLEVTKAMEIVHNSPKH